MIGIGQIIIQALGALWRLRWTVLPLAAAWLAIDGLLIGYLRFHPSHPINTWIGELLDPRIIGQGILYFVLSANAQAFIGNVVRAVFVVIILRALLSPSSDPAKGQPREFIFPMVLVLLFEVAWTAILLPFEEVALLARSFDLIERQTAVVVFQWAPVPVYVGYSLAMSRLCFAYPSAALGLSLRLRQSWHETKGLALRLFLVFLAAAAPFAILHGVLKELFLDHMIATKSYEYIWLYSSVERSLRSVPRDVLVLAMIAVAYVAATGIQSRAIPGANQASKRLS